MKLTNKEASEWLMAIKRDYIYGGDEDYDKRRKIALDMGAEALENQKSVIAELEKIRRILNYWANEHIDGDYYVRLKDINEVFDEELSKLKGENNE